MHLPALPSEQRPKVSSRGLGPYGKIGVRKFVRNVKPSKVFIGQVWLVFLAESQPLEKFKKKTKKQQVPCCCKKDRALKLVVKSDL